MKYHNAALLLSLLPLSSALPISISTFYCSIQQVLDTVSDKLRPASSDPSVASLIPEQEYESWIDNESDIAFESIIQNIGGYGSVEGVMAGSVVASPSKQYPDYFYQVSWHPQKKHFSDVECNQKSNTVSIAVEAFQKY